MPRHVKDNKEPWVQWGFRTVSAPFCVRYVSCASVSEIIGKLIRNPNYGGPKTSHPLRYPWQPIPEVGFKPSFFAALEADVKENGFRNPVILHSMTEGIYLQFGASRYRVARKLGLETMPAIVVDWCERFKECTPVHEKNWRAFFTDVPKYFAFTGEGVDHNYALERNMRSEYDPAGFAWSGTDAPFIDEDFQWLRNR